MTDVEIGIHKIAEKKKTIKVCFVRIRINIFIYDNVNMNYLLRSRGLTTKLAYTMWPFVCDLNEHETIVKRNVTF